MEVGRRQFLALLGSGIVVVLSSAELLAADGESGASPQSERRGAAGAPPTIIDAWLHVGAEGRVTVFTGKVEVGQGVRTSLAQVVAEELDVPLTSIEMVMGDTNLTPFDMGTFGSQTTRVMGAHLREVAAAAREAIIERAAARWEVPVTELFTDNGKVVHGQRLREATYGDLTRGEKIVREVGRGVPTKPTSRWTIAGRARPRLEARAKVTGAARYAADLRLPGMVFGRIVRPPSFGARVRGIDVSAAEKIPGVIKVVRDRDLVGVVAEQPAIAGQAAEAIKVQWAERDQPADAELFVTLKRSAGRRFPWPAFGPSATAKVLAETGSLADGFRLSATISSREYRAAYIAHAPLEPRAAVAQWRGKALTVWTSTQRPFGVRAELAERFTLPEESVRVIVPETGGAYGGKHTGEAAAEAATLARAVGRPVQIAWTREEEFTWAYFRPAALIEIKSGLSAAGTLLAWEYHNYNSGERGAISPYTIPHTKTMFHPSQSPLRQGSYRALANCANSFARESHIDELAASLGQDPIEFRLKRISDERLSAVVKAAESAFQWKPQRGPSSGNMSRGGASPSLVARGVGFACGIDVGTYVAEIAEVEVDKRSGQMKILRVVAALDCGCVINPDELNNQIEGAIIQGIGGALREEIRFADGKILNTTFGAYPVPRFSDAPPIEVVVLNRQDVPSSGAGEPPIIAIAPAIANALFNATGVRLRELPMSTDRIRAALVGS